MKKIRFIAALAFFVFIMPVTGDDILKKYDIYGHVEALKKNEITVILMEKPLTAEYLLIHDDREIGRVTVKAVIHTGKAPYKFRAAGDLVLSVKGAESLLKPGRGIALRANPEKKKRDFSHPSFKETVVHKQRIKTEPDGRDMVLVAAGKFIMGNNNGEDDEKPERIEYVGSFYVDVYEVSNKDYLLFVRSANARPPKAWEGGTYDEKDALLPVMITWHEAEAYAKWTGKRLPTEEEWEKAARGMPDSLTAPSKKMRYPWGDRFDPSLCNSAEFWKKPETGREIKLLYTSAEPAPLPVAFFQAGSSPVGALNMSGNAREWTSSWYRAYKGNFRKNPLYGTQYRVIRGGGWFSSREALSTSSREYGGAPNLFSDNSAGFRCVKDTAILDKEIQPGGI
jgi:formylglycine-generating enzyme required for sulfatase activity